jgi:hypothetical protein
MEGLSVIIDPFLDKMGDNYIPFGMVKSEKTWVIIVVIGQQCNP